jgi:hypothetical protein
MDHSLKWLSWPEIYPAGGILMSGKKDVCKSFTVAQVYDFMGKSGGKIFLSLLPI